jgi:Zn-dependent protease with chaperone function
LKEKMKRIILFVLTNVAVVAVLGIVASLLGVNRYLTANGLNLGLLLGYALVIGFGGAFISLLISKPMAKWSAGVQIIEQPQSPDEAWIVNTVRKLADQAGIGMPEVGIFEGEPNAFATGAFKNSALVAVSTGLLQGMTRDEVEAVIGHEITHISNGDMVTMSLIQGHGHHVADPGCDEYFCGVPEPRDRLCGGQLFAPWRQPQQWPRHRLHDHHVRARYRAWFSGCHHRGLVLAPARVPR